jgi:hypothetical protein
VTQGDATEKLWLRDEQGNLYVLTPEVLDAIRVPEEHRAEAEAVVGGHAADAGFIDAHLLATQQRATSAPLSFTLASVTLHLVGRCTCDRDFGVTSENSRVARLVVEYRAAARDLERAFAEYPAGCPEWLAAVERANAARRALDAALAIE